MYFRATAESCPPVEVGGVQAPKSVSARLRIACASVAPDLIAATSAAHRMPSIVPTMKPRQFPPFGSSLQTSIMTLPLNCCASTAETLSSSVAATLMKMPVLNKNIPPICDNQQRLNEDVNAPQRTGATYPTLQDALPYFQRHRQALRCFQGNARSATFPVANSHLRTATSQ